MGFLGAIFDITEKRKLERALADLAATDELTRLPNRREGLAQLEFLHKDSLRKKRPYSVAVIDIDHFKKLNDQYGRACGDIVLQAFAVLAKRALRGRDVCFRYGGEEFVILLPETTLAEGHRVVERLRRDWGESELTLPGGRAVQVTFSVGLAQFSMSGVTFDAVVKAADMALYEAKNNGRNQTVCAPNPDA